MPQGTFYRLSEFNFTGIQGWDGGVRVLRVSGGLGGRGKLIGTYGLGALQLLGHPMAISDVFLGKNMIK